MKNNQKKKMFVSVALTILFGLIFVIGINLFSELGEFAGLIILMSLLISITSFVCIFIFNKRSKSFENAIQNKTGKIFSYDKKEWTQYIKEDTKLRNAEKKAIFIFLTIITIIIFAIFILIIEEAKLEMFIVGLLLIGLYAFMAFVVPILSKSLKNKKDREIMIFPKGIIIGNTFHTWDFPLSKLSSVKEKKKPFEYIQVSYEFFDRLGPRSYTIRLPFPKNKEEFRKAIKNLK